MTHAHAGPDVLQLLLSPRIGGAETLAASLETQFRQAGLRSAVAYLDAPSGPRTGPARRIANVRRAVAQARPDVVIAHSALPNLYGRLATGRRVPVVTVLHSATDDHADPRLRWAERALRRRTAHVVAVSAGQAQDYRRWFGDRVPVSVIPNGIRPDLPQRTPVARGPKHVVALARIAPQKDPQLWVDVVQGAAGRDSGWLFSWWGPADQDGGVVEAARAAGAEAAVASFRGPTDDSGSVLASADVLLHTARAEAHSIALLEAAAVGVPIVCSPAVAATLPPQVPVHTFAEATTDGVMSALEAVAARWPEHQASALDAAAWVRRTCSAQATASRYLSLITDLRRGRRRRDGLS